MEEDYDRVILNRLARSIAESRTRRSIPDSLKEEVIDFLSQHNAILPVFDESVYTEILLMADALQKEIESNPMEMKVVSRKTKSSSIFNTGSFAPPFIWENVNNASQEEIIRELAKVEYVDDLVPDWNDILLFLKDTDHDKFAAIHHALFEKSRTSLEHEVLQQGILESVFSRVQWILNDKGTKVDALPDIVVLFKKIWMDCMERTVCLRSANHIGQTIWNTLLKPHKEQPSAFIRCMKDTKAEWFSAWTRHLSIHDVLQLVDDSFSILPMLVNRSERKDELGGYFTCILRSILVKIRVSLFPWHVLADYSKEQAMDLLFQIFMSRLNDPERLPVALESLEVLIIGTRISEPKINQHFENSLREYLRMNEHPDTTKHLLEQLLLDST